MRYKPGEISDAIQERTMNTRKKCGCKGEVSRREMLQAGLGAAMVAACNPAGLFAHSAIAKGETQGRSPAKQDAAAAGLRAIDIHAHYYPQNFVDLIAEEGKRFKAEYRMASDGFYVSAPAGSIGPLPTKFIDLKQRLADMDEQGVSPRIPGNFAARLSSSMARSGSSIGRIISATNRFG
jgi:hypothetical protein